MPLHAKAEPAELVEDEGAVILMWIDLEAPEVVVNGYEVARPLVVPAACRDDGTRGVELKSVKDIIESNVCFYSYASFWEISIKQSKKKFRR